MATSTKQRFVVTASRLFQEKGYEATSVGEVARAGELPIGSLYYHFPEGKVQLGVAAIEHAAEAFAKSIRSDLEAAATPGEALAGVLLGLADRMEAQNWSDGCAVAAVSVEMVHRSDELQAAAGAAFGSWVSEIADRLVELGIGRSDAVEVASITVSLLEGAEMMARVEGSRQPLELAARGAARLVEGLDR